VTVVQVEMSTSQLPTAMSTTGSDDGIEDIFFEAIVQFILYKALSADDEGIDSAKAQQHFTNFIQLLTADSAAAFNKGPETKE
jgi:hypothetical protein